MRIKRSLKKLVNSKRKFLIKNNHFFLVGLLGLIVIVLASAALISEPSVTGAFIGIFTSPTQDTPIINSTYAANTTQENLTVYPQTVVCEGACKNITDWRLWNGSDNVSIAVLNMPFEGGSSSDNQSNVADYSSYVNNGTNFHNVTYNATGGYDGFGAFEFDGEDDCIDIGNDNSLRLNTSLTVAGWTYPISATNADIVTQAAQSYRTYFGSDRYISLRLNTNDVILSTTKTVPLNTWTFFFAATWNTTEVRIYINGLLNNSADYSGTFAQRSDNLGVGCNLAGLNNYFNGTIDEVMVFNRPLSADEIYSIYSNRTDILSSDETSIGDEWIACTTPNNATGDGTTKCSENITILAASNPSVSSLIPTNTSNYTTSQTIEIAANVTDDISVSSVTANVSIPNGTIKEVSLSLATGSKYNNSFAIRNVTGTYNITFIALDNYNNLNQSETTTFNVAHTGPVVNLVSPENYTWTTDTTPDFQFNFTDDVSAEAHCTVLVDGSITATNTTVLNNTLTIVTSSALTSGTHDWTVNCTDDEGGYNISAVNYTIDIVEKPTITAPDNNTLTSNSSINSTDFTFNFTSNMVAGAGTNSASCELFITNATGDIANNINTTTLNGTETILKNNQTLTLGSPTWFINCTYNNTIISSDTYTLNVDTETPAISLTTPTNNSWTSETRADNVSFTFSFTAGNADQSSCELFITNASGTDIANGVNTTTLNGTATIIKNNNSLLGTLNPNGVKANWTVNCTFNSTTITTGYYSLNVDNQTPSFTTAPAISSITTSAAALTAKTSEAVTCKYSTSDLGYDSMTEFGTTAVTSHSTSLGGLSSGTGYIYYVKCRDSALLICSGSTSFTTTSVSGGSGSSGAGGGVSAGVLGQFEKKIWTSINQGETAKMEVRNGIIGVTEIAFKVKNNAYGVWINVEKVDTLPKTIKTIPRKVYSNIKITENNVEKAMEKATIKFKVLKSWLTENQLAKSNIALYRYQDDKWHELTTTLGEDDGTYIHYAAETSGFSYFTIGAKETIAPEEITEEVAEVVALPKEVEEITEEKKPFNKLWLVPIFTAIIGIIIIVYSLLKKKKRPKRN
jgi:PGF-pre-PGF domain-containing protein